MLQGPRAEPEKYANVDEHRFRRMSKAMWRKKTSSEKAKTRALKLKEELKKCDREVDESKREHRRRIITNVAVAIASFVASVLALPEAVIVEVEDAFEAWVQECERSIQDVTYVSRFVSVGCNILDNTMQFASALCLVSNWCTQTRRVGVHECIYDQPLIITLYVAVLVI